MTTLTPLPPHCLFGHLSRPVWAVVRDGRTIGEIEQVGTPPTVRYDWRVVGAPWFLPTSTGAWWLAQELIERHADDPVPMRLDIPLRLRITRVEDGQETPV